MTVEYKDSKRIVALSSDVLNTPTYSDDFSSSTGWTQTGTSVTVSSGIAGGTTVDLNSDDRIDKSITTISDSIWTSYFDFKLNSFSNSADTSFTLLSINDGTGDLIAGDALIVQCAELSSTPQVRLRTYLSGTANVTSSSITINLTQTYYGIVRRLSTTEYDLRIFSDSARTTQIGSTTLSGANANVGGFDNVGTGATFGFGNASDTANYTLDNLKIYDGISSTTNKPTDVQDNSLLIEKDTARRYWFSEATPTTFENDFGTTSDWTKVGTTITVNDHVSGKCSINDPANSSSDRVYKSLGVTLSDTAWVATCEINISAISGSERAFPVQFSSTTGSYRSSHDSIAIRLGGDLSGSSPSIGMSRNDGGTVIHLTDANSIQVSTGTLYYVKIWRDGSDLKLAVYTNSDYETGQVGSTQTHQSLGSPTGLSNVVIGSDDASTGGVNATVDNLKVYNNVTTATPATWTMEPTFQDDFSSDNWTDSGSNVDISSGVMNFDIDRTTTDQSSYYQLSSALSDTKWVVRLHDVIVTTKSGGVEVFIGVSSNTSGAQTAQDFIGLNLGDNTANPVLGGVDSDGAVIARLAGDYTYSLSTTYNIEIIRESATSYRIKVFSNSGFDSTVLFSQSYTCTATTTGLQYVKFANGQVAGSTENIIGTCSKIEIYNGVTSIN